MSRRSRILLSIYFGFAAYCLVVLVFGSTGIIANSELKAYRSRLETNLSHLEATNAQLASRFDALRGNPETIKLEARQLGYLEPGERLLQVSGYSRRSNAFTVGSLVRERHHVVTPDAVSRWIGLTVAVIAFILLGIVARRRNGSVKR